MTDIDAKARLNMDDVTELVKPIPKETIEQTHAWCDQRKKDKPWYTDGDSPKLLTTCNFMMALIDEVLASREAADTLEALQAENTRLAAERDRCHQRLEIDHIYRMPTGAETADDLIREEVHITERDKMIDGIECRDETIKLQDAEIAQCKAENTRLRAEIERLTPIAAAYDYLEAPQRSLSKEPTDG